MNRLTFLLGAATLTASFATPAAATPQSRITGSVVAVSANVMLLRTRNGKSVTVDLTEARAKGRVGVLAPRTAVIVFGKSLPDGTFHCTQTGHAARSPASWEPDR
jgi:hypothetical protein